jgi:hypothetical protein
MVNGEEHLQQHYKGFTFDIPHPDARGPFYIVTRGRRVGIFNTWYVSFLNTVLYSDILSGHILLPTFSESVVRLTLVRGPGLMASFACLMQSS